jgi:hypothetical protein
MASQDTGVEVKIDHGAVLLGLNKLRAEMKSVEPELKKEMDRTIRAHLKPLAEAAKARVPDSVVSGWRIRPNSSDKWSQSGSRSIGWDPTYVRKQIVIRQGGRARPKKGVPSGSTPLGAWALKSLSGAGSIFEFTAKSHKPQSRGFVEQMMRKGPPSRLIWGAWDSAGGDKKFTEGTVSIIHDFERRFNQKLKK